MLTALLLAVSFGAGPPAAPAHPDWARVKAGMSQAEVQHELGAPLLRNAGRGLEVWIYDAGANIVFVHQQVDYLTPPPAVPPAPVIAIKPAVKPVPPKPVLVAGPPAKPATAPAPVPPPVLPATVPKVAVR